MTEDSILQKVQKLVDKAWSTNFPAEREALLAKADALMVKYSIEQFQLMDPSRPNTAGSVKGQEPELRDIWYFGPNTKMTDDTELNTAIQQMFYSVATHCGTRVGWFGFSYSKVVGYPSDLDFLEMMFTSLKIHLLSTTDPQVVNDLPWQANLIALKNSGYKWEDIHKKLLSHPNYKFVGLPWERNIGVSFTSVYKKWRDENQEEAHNTGSPQQWRRSFILGYTQMIRDRLHEMRRQTLENDKNLPALLDDKKSKIDEAYYVFFPQSPTTSSSSGKGKVTRYRKYVAPSVSGAAIKAGQNAARNADLSGRSSRIGGHKGAIG